MLLALNFFVSIGTFLLKLLLLVFVLGIIILVHEFGHFIWAKKFGVHIYEFSIGMGPIIFTKKGKDKIDYNIRAIPIGGFVSMAGEVYEDDKKIKKDKLMCNKPWYQRLIILCAGVFNNFILAILLLSIYALVWGGGAIKPVISDVVQNSAAEEAGIQKGDRILAINNHKVSSWDKAQIILYYKNKSNVYDFKVKHKNGAIENIKITPKTIKDNETGTKQKVFGLAIKNENTKNPIKALWYGIRKFIAIISSMVATIVGLVTKNISLNALSGPVGIYEVVASSFALTFGMALRYIVYIIAFLSANVGFINILPFPAFDGGHVLFLIIEKIKGSPVDSKIENIFHIIGFILIILLMIIVTINDIIKLF